MFLQKKMIHVIKKQIYKIAHKLDDKDVERKFDNAIKNVKKYIIFIYI